MSTAPKPNTEKVAIQVDQAGTMWVETPATFAIQSVLYRSNDTICFKCSTRVVKLVRHGFPWIKICNERLLILSEPGFFYADDSWWILKGEPRAKTRTNMIYLFYGEKVL